MLEAQAVGGPQAVGSRLAAARTAKGWSIEQAASALKVPVHVVDSLEQGEWQRLGAPVFVRGQLRSYARHLAIDPGSLLGGAEVEQWVPVHLVSHVRSQRLRRWTDGMGRGLLYLVATMVVVGLLVLLLRQQWSGDATVASLDDFPVAAPSHTAAESAVQTLPMDTPATAAVTGTGQAVEAVALIDAPVADALPDAGSSSAPVATPAAARGQLQLAFADQSWIEIHGRDGRVIERAMVSSGQTRSYPMAELGRVLLGNSASITARLDGQPLDLSPFRRSNVARFTVSSDGSASPVAH